MSEKSLRGFAAMDKEKQRAIASKGGRAAHQKGTAHEFTSEEARAAGRKGGQAAHAKGTAHEFTPDEARAAGRKGGSAHSPATANGSQPHAAAPQQPPQMSQANPEIRMES
jgi:general stress protein YciG